MNRHSSLSNSLFVRILYAAIPLLCIGNSSFASSAIPKDSLAKDFLFFCDKLESSHPDPYSAFGGKPYFSLARDMALERILSDSLSVNGFCDLLNEFIIPLKDMHTFVNYPNSNEVNEIRYVQRISFNVLNDGLMVAGIAEPYSQYLGSRLLAINDVPADSLYKRMEKIKPSENRADNMQNLSLWGNQDRILDRLGVNVNGNDRVYYQLLTPQADTISLELPIVEREHIADVEMARLKSSLNLPKGNLQYDFIDGKGNVMYLRLSSVMARENYKYCYDQGWDNARGDIEYHYKSVGKDMPENIEEAINAIPSFFEEFYGMLTEMKDKGAEYLIIDLRGNGGGWTPITLPSLMMMFGDDYFSKRFEVKNIRLISDLYLHKTNQTIEELNRSWGTSMKLGDYLFMDNDYQGDDIASIRKMMIQNAMTEIPEILQSLDGKQLYQPKQIFVITDPGTFSAAFHYAFYLHKMGATLVGVPSGQAPNTFMEVTPFTLPCSGLSASISNTLQQFFPKDSPLAKELIPDVRIMSQDYARYNLDADTPVLKILDICRGE